MREFRDAGVNMWYDEGIQPAGEWVEEIAHAIAITLPVMATFLLYKFFAFREKYYG